MRLTRRPAVLLAPALVLLLLAACSGGKGKSTASPDDVTAESPAAAEPTEEADDDVAAGSGGAACLEGEWQTDGEVAGQATISAFGFDDMGADAVVTTPAVVTLDGSTMNTVYDDQRTEVSWSLERQRFTIAVDYDGTVSSAYSATDTELTITPIDLSGLTLETTTLVNGEPVELPGLTDAIWVELTMEGTYTYTCAGDELRIQPIAEGVDTSNYVSVMHRR